MVVPFVYTEEEYKKLEKERDNCLKEVKLCYNDIHSLEGQISDLEERIRFLEQCLDNKEKVNISLREENNKLKAELQEWLNAVGNH